MLTQTNRSRTKQDWTPGATVKVGFMKLTVLRKVATPGDFYPDVYHLTATNGRAYTFQPHHGLSAGHHLGAGEVS